MNDQVALFMSEVTRVASEVSTEVEARRPGRGTRPFTLAMYYLVNDQQAPAWWTLADAGGNEADVGTWMRPCSPHAPLPETRTVVRGRPRASMYRKRLYKTLSLHLEPQASLKGCVGRTSERLASRRPGSDRRS